MSAYQTLAPYGREGDVRTDKMSRTALATQIASIVLGDSMHIEVAATQPHHIYNLLIGLVAPRPIALVTSMNEDGRINAAPFSAYNYLCTDPPVLALGVTNRPGGKYVPKDTARNIRRTREFVVNVVTEDIAPQMNICATDFPADVDELEMAGLETEPSKIVKVPRIKQAHAALECEEFTSMEIGNSRIILGKVLAMYVEDRFVDPAGPYILSEELHAVGRMNGLGGYVKTQGAAFKMPRIPYDEWQKGRRE
jgi:flavin reductase (DIM6/NTAB) family NADH-FMN oxidoreductase RutF